MSLVVQVFGRRHDATVCSEKIKRLRRGVRRERARLNLRAFEATLSKSCSAREPWRRRIGRLSEIYAQHISIATDCTPDFVVRHSKDSRSVHRCPTIILSLPAGASKDVLPVQGSTIFVTVRLLIESSQRLHDFIKVYWGTVRACTQTRRGFDGTGV